MSKPTGWNSSLWKVRERAVQLVAEARGPDAVDLLVEALEDISWRVQLAAVSALRDFPEPRTAAPLLKACYAENGEVVKAAASVIGFPSPPNEITVSGLAALHGSADERSRTAVERYALDTTRPEALPILAAMVRDGKAEMRVLACRKIPELATVQGANSADLYAAIRALLEMAAAGEREDRLDALRALGRVAKWIAVSDLEPLCADPDPGIAREAVEVVGLIGGVPARELVGKLLHSDVPAVRLGAVNALASFDRPAYCEALAQAVKDPSDLVRFGVAEGMSAGAPPEACTAVAALLSDPVSLIRLAAVAALARSSSTTSLGLLAECASSPSPETKASAVEFVRGLGGPAALADTMLQSPSPSHYERARAFLRLHGLEGFDSMRYLRSASDQSAGPYWQLARETLDAISEMGTLLRSATGSVSEGESKELLRAAGPGASEERQLLRAPLPDWVRSDEELLRGPGEQSEGLGGWLRSFLGPDDPHASDG